MAAMAACSLLLSFAAVPLASADDLHDRKQRVERGIQQARKHLDQSSAKLVSATRALEAAETRLAVAERQLAKTRGQLAAAVVLDRQMQARLDVAVHRLEEAREALAAGQKDLGKQIDVLAQIAVQNYQTGDPNLLGLSMVLTSQDPAELTTQLNAVRNVLDKESATLDRLEAANVLLTVREQEVEDAKAEVAEQRRAAAANLRKKTRLEQRARVAEERVSGLVAVREDARKDAAAARAEDLAMLQQLEKERDQISALLAKRAARAAKKAAAAAKKNAAPPASPAGFMVQPVDGWVSSEYGMRFHPVYKRWALHDGIDFAAPCGTPIRAAASGRVIAMYFNEGYGKRVIVDHGYARGVGVGTSYNHLDSYSTYVGDQVQRGEVIGYVGNTGYSTGCHLHFMVFENGRTVNPRGWL